MGTAETTAPQHVSTLHQTRAHEDHRDIHSLPCLRPEEEVEFSVSPSGGSEICLVLGPQHPAPPHTGAYMETQDIHTSKVRIG